MFALAKLKTIGCALLVSVGLLALGSTAAEAAEFHTEVNHEILHGATVEPVKLLFGGGVNVECEEPQGPQYGYTNTVTTSTDFTVVPTAVSTPCVIFGKYIGATHFNGCDFRLSGAQSIEGHTRYGASADLICPAGKAIELTATVLGAKCTVTIGSQSALGSVDLHNKGVLNTRTVLLEWTLSGLHYSRHGGGFCASVFAATGTFAMTGRVSITGIDESGLQRGFWVT